LHVVGAHAKARVTSSEPSAILCRRPDRCCLMRTAPSCGLAQSFARSARLTTCAARERGSGCCRTTTQGWCRASCGTPGRRTAPWSSVHGSRQEAPWTCAGRCWRSRTHRARSWRSHVVQPIRRRGSGPSRGVSSLRPEQQDLLDCEKLAPPVSRLVQVEGWSPWSAEASGSAPRRALRARRAHSQSAKAPWRG
jgi:hypothetical protein